MSEMQRIARVETPHADKYLAQLAKHFEHKLPVTRHEDGTAEIPFTVGTCHLRAEETALTLRLVAPGEAELPQLEDVVVRHLVRFAFREELVFDWRPA